MAERLSALQARFCAAFAECGDAREAALRAGYCRKNARRCGERNLANPLVARELARLRKTSNRAKAKPQVGGGVAKKTEILEFLTGVMRGELYDRREAGENGELSVLAELPKLSERTRAAELLGKSRRLFSDKTEKSTGKVCVVRILGEDKLED